MAELLAIRNLTVKYGETAAVNNLSLHLAPGEKCALVGANGAGKTSLLLALVGANDSEGTVSIGGTALTRDSLGEIRRRAGMVFQNPDDQLFLPTVRQDVEFGLKNLGLPPEECTRRAEACLGRLGIGHLGDRSALHLSGGEKRMAALATVLVLEPAVLLLDEPTAFLDPGARRRLLQVLRELPQTMLIATHDLSFALALCPRAALLLKGQLLAEGPSETLLYDRETMARGGVEDIRTFYGGIL